MGIWWVIRKQSNSTTADSLSQRATEKLSGVPGEHRKIMDQKSAVQGQGYVCSWLLMIQRRTDRLYSCEGHESDTSNCATPHYEGNRGSIPRQRLSCVRKEPSQYTDENIMCYSECTPELERMHPCHKCLVAVKLMSLRGNSMRQKQVHAGLGHASFQPLRGI